VFAFLCQPVGFVLGVIGIVTVGRSQGRVGGMGLAIAGTLVSAFIGLFFCLPFGLAVAIPAYLVARIDPAEGIAKSTLQSIHAAEQRRLAKAGAYAGLEELQGGDYLPVDACPPGSSGVAEKSGYCFVVIVRGPDSFVAYAWPSDGSRKNRSMFAVTEDGVTMVRTPSPCVGPGDVPHADEVKKPAWKAVPTYTSSSSFDWDD